jgi:hypothetical protein
MPFAHIAGIPVEETLAMAAPPLTVFVGLAVAQLRARFSPPRRGRAAAPRRSSRD